MWIRRARLPLPGLVVGAAQRVAQRSSPSGGSPELLRELPEQALAVEIAAGSPDLALEDGRIREVLEERDDVGERLVEGLDVTVRRLVEARVNAVEKGMRRLVRDDVVRETGEDDRPRRVVLVLRGDREVAEEQRLLRGR